MKSGLEDSFSKIILVILKFSFLYDLKPCSYPFLSERILVSLENNDLDIKKRPLHRGICSRG